MTQILLEKYLASQFKFGFELEAMVEDALIDFSDDYHDEVDYDSLNEAIKEEISTAFNFSEDEIEIKYDGSLEPSNRFDYAFEWATPTMQFTPENLKRSIHGLDYLMKHNFYTNESCGFHVHLSFPNITDQDVIWIISKLSIDKPMFKKITNFEGLNFFNEEYAEKGVFEKIGKLINEEKYSELAQYFSTKKYRMLHIHPQGTLEWRGPRDFLDDYEGIHIVYDFFKLLYEFVSWMSKSISDNHINGISKENYFKLVFGEDVKVNDYIDNFNKKSRFSKMKNIISDDIEKKYVNRFIKLMIKNKSDYTPSVEKILLLYIDDMYADFTFATNILKKLIEMDDISTIRYFFNLLINENNDFGSFFNNNIEYTLFEKIVEYLLQFKEDEKYISNYVYRYFSNLSQDKKYVFEYFVKKFYDKLPSNTWEKMFQSLGMIYKYGKYIIDEKMFPRDFIIVLLERGLFESSDVSDIVSKITDLATQNKNNKIFVKCLYNTVYDFINVYSDFEERVNNLKGVDNKAYEFYSKIANAIKQIKENLNRIMK